MKQANQSCRSSLKGSAHNLSPPLILIWFACSSFYNAPVSVEIKHCREDASDPGVFDREVDLRVFGEVRHASTPPTPARSPR